MPRVLHVISGIDPSNGGPTTALLGLSAAQVRAGMAVTVAATWQQQEGLDHAGAFRQRGVAVQMIGRASGALSRHPEILPTLGRLIDAHDVVHVHACWEQIQHDAATLARRKRKPYVWRPCGLLLPSHMRKGTTKKKLYLAWRLKRDLNGAAAIHFATTQEEELTRSWLRLRPPSLVEPNGIDLPAPGSVPDASELRRILPEIGGRKVVLFLSRISHEKGLDMLIPAFMRAGLEGHVLVIVGSDPQRPHYREEVDAVIRACDAQRHVILAGQRYGHEKLASYAGAEFLALTSYAESFGNVVIESLAVGKPVLVTTGVGLARDVERGRVGIVVEPNVDAIAGALRRLATDDSLRESLATNSRAFAERFAWDAIARRWADHYRRYVGGGSRSS